MVGRFLSIRLQRMMKRVENSEQLRSDDYLNRAL